MELMFVQFVPFAPNAPSVTNGSIRQCCIAQRAMLLCEINAGVGAWMM
jgi:hypothetical protein